MTLNEAKPVANINKNLPSFQDHGLKEDKPSQRNFQNHLSNSSLSHIEQECQESLIQGKIRIQEKSNKDLKYL